MDKWIDDKEEKNQAPGLRPLWSEDVGGRGERWLCVEGRTGPAGASSHSAPPGPSRPPPGPVPPQECNAAIHKKCIDKIIGRCTGTAANSRDTIVRLGPGRQWGGGGGIWAVSTPSLSGHPSSLFSFILPSSGLTPGIPWISHSPWGPLGKSTVCGVGLGKVKG